MQLSALVREKEKVFQAHVDHVAARRIATKVMPQDWNHIYKTKGLFSVPKDRNFTTDANRSALKPKKCYKECQRHPLHYPNIKHNAFGNLSESGISSA